MKEGQHLFTQIRSRKVSKKGHLLKFKFCKVKLFILTFLQECQGNYQQENW